MILILVALLAAVPAATLRVEQELPDQPPGKPAQEDALARTPGMRVPFGSYESIQVNVDALGQNVVGDAANEPSIAVNPVNPSNMVLGFRQFTTVTSNFRQAGKAYTFDGGDHWVFNGVLDPGIFRSDPSVDVDSWGTFYYQSLRGPGVNRVEVFYSIDGGISWSTPFAANGGDKNWLAVDRTGGPGNGFLYGIWQRYASCCGNNVFTRSSTGGVYWHTPVPVPLFPTFGTLAVGPTGTVYATGFEGSPPSGPDPTRFVVARSANASDPNVPATFTSVEVDLGGAGRAFAAPNPDGLLGQPYVFTQGSNVYLLASVVPPGDPLDVHVIRSLDGGTTWAEAVRVNDDAPGSWQWMGAGAAAPSGRVDALWFDTRNGAGNMNLAQLFYAYSWDGGTTWSPNVAVTPSFDTSIGYPQQDKLGDYFTLVSGETGADVAFAATFNGEQDIYYVRVFPDCNGNGVSDVTDLAGASLDCDADHVPDECQAAPACLGAGGLGGLTVARSPAGDLTLHWSGSCHAGDGDYAVYEGVLGSFSSHTPRACTTAGATSQVLTPAAGDTYYLVVPTQADREGSYGQEGPGIERPAAASACFPQDVRACSP